MSAAETTASVELGEKTGLRDVPLDSDGIRVTVDEGDTRTCESVEEAVQARYDYLDAKENQSLILEDKESGDLLAVPHTHRWSPEYREKLYARLKAAERHVLAKWGEEVPTTMLTLTAPHNDESGDARPFTAVLDDLKDGLDKARHVIRRETEGIETEYLAVLEPHATGYPHVHILVFGVASESLGEKVVDYWANRYVEGASRDAQDVKAIRGRDAQLRSPAAYVMKYLSKTLAREGGDETTDRECEPSIAGYAEFSALMWATGKRTYSMSGGLTEAISEEAPESEPTPGDWEYIGTASGVEAGLYTGEEAEKLGKYLAGSKNQQVPPRDTERPIYGTIG